MQTSGIPKKGDIQEMVKKQNREKLCEYEKCNGNRIIAEAGTVCCSLQNVYMYN